jgi:hypothetical protein
MITVTVKLTPEQATALLRFLRRVDVADIEKTPKWFTK